jgi:hypothetical protein
MLGRILLIEDDRHLGAQVVAHLHKAGFETVWWTEGKPPFADGGCSTAGSTPGNGLAIALEVGLALTLLASRGRSKRFYFRRLLPSARSSPLRYLTQYLMLRKRLSARALVMLYTPHLK